MLLSGERNSEYVVERSELQNMSFSVNKTPSPFSKKVSSKFPSLLPFSTAETFSYQPKKGPDIFHTIT